MRRGFKALAERIATSARVDLGLAGTAPLDPWAYSQHLCVIILDFHSLDLQAEVQQQLTVKDTDSWSAMTLQLNQKFAIVINPAHAATRQRSDLMHELAHIRLQHTPSRVEVSKNGLMLLGDYSDDHEQEADWLGAALLVPREGLIQMRANNMPANAIAQYYGISETLCAWRLRMTGVDLQVRRARGR